MTRLSRRGAPTCALRRRKESVTLLVVVGWVEERRRSLLERVTQLIWLAGILRANLTDILPLGFGYRSTQPTFLVKFYSLFIRQLLNP